MYTVIKDRELCRKLVMFMARHLLQGDIKKFQNTIYSYYKKHQRDFVWRRTRNPYRILVSEIMLQQTQTQRVEKKFPEFIKMFPNFQALAAMPFGDVLRAWQGMGYNRRALALHAIAKRVVGEYGGHVPCDLALLKTLPGIGPNTAGAIVAFAFNKPVVFIETNIRSVFIHFFFRDKKNVRDDVLLPLVEQALDREQPREWYCALMDYGAMLKQAVVNPSRTSAHYTKQSQFEGSNRQVRGGILKLLSAYKHMESRSIAKILKEPLARVDNNLAQLQKEGFIKKKKVYYALV